MLEEERGRIPQRVSGANLLKERLLAEATLAHVRGMNGVWECWGWLHFGTVVALPALNYVSESLPMEMSHHRRWAEGKIPS